MAPRNIVIVMARCSRSKQAYGIRFQRQSANQWAATWAFALKESVAKREGYEKSQMTGSFVLADAYPGCPHCPSHGFFHCECGKLACWNGEQRTVTCPTCGRTGELTGAITSLTGGTDR